MSEMGAERQLKSLVGDIGAAYRRRLLPPTWLMLLALASGIAWACGREVVPAALAAVAFGFSGLVTFWARRRRPGPPGWRSLGLLLALLAAFAPEFGHGVLRWPVLAGAALTLALLALHVARVLEHAQQVRQWADLLDDAAILRILPSEARDDARHWLGGHDGAQLELAMVIHLAVLWTALGSAQPWLPPALQQRLAG